MTRREAYTKAKKLPGNNVLLRALESKDFWVFQFHNESVRPGEMIIGGSYIIVDRRTNILSTIPIFMAQNTIKQCTDLDISQFK